MNLVFEAEILPYNLALHCWGGLLSKKHVHQGTLKESELDTIPYFCRVPTSSNLADGPSRLDFRMCYGGK